MFDGHGFHALRSALMVTKGQNSCIQVNFSQAVINAFLVTRANTDHVTRANTDHVTRAHTP